MNPDVAIKIAASIPSSPVAARPTTSYLRSRPSGRMDERLMAERWPARVALGGGTGRDEAAARGSRCR
jgi:hypothetical protein